MPVDQDIKAQIAADAAASLEDAPDEDAGTAAGKENTDVVEDEPSEDVTEDDTSDEGEDEDDVETDTEDVEEDDDVIDETETDPEPKSRASKRIRELNSKFKESERQREILQKQIDSMNKPKEEVDEVDRKLIEQGYKKEEIESAKRFLEALGLSPNEIADMRNQLKSSQREKAIEADRADLRAAITATSTELSEQQIMEQVQKWAKSEDERIRARASLDYPSIIRLMNPSKKKVVRKKEVAPEVPKDTTDPTKSEAKPDFEWDPGDPIGSLDRLRDAAYDG